MQRSDAGRSRRRAVGATVAALVALVACGSTETTARPGSTRSPPPSLAPSTAPSPSIPVVSPGPTPAVGPLLCAPAGGPLTTTGTPVLQSVSARAHPGYDALIFAFAPVGAGRPAAVATTFTVAPARPPFVRDASGAPVHVTGTAFLQVQFHGAYGYDPLDSPPQATYTGPQDLLAGLAGIAEVRETGDFEGSLTWVVGLTTRPCWYPVPGENQLELDVPT